MRGRKILEKIESEFSREDETEKFLDRDYVKETHRILKMLIESDGGEKDSEDKAIYDIVNDIFRYLKVE